MSLRAGNVEAISAQNMFIVANTFIPLRILSKCLMTNAYKCTYSQCNLEEYDLTLL